MTVDTITLASGRKMPLRGFGLWKVPADKATDIVYNVSKTFCDHVKSGLRREKGYASRRCCTSIEQYAEIQ